MTHTSTPTKPRIEISICPTGLEVGEDVMDASALADVRAQDALGATCGAAVAADGGAA